MKISLRRENSILAGFFHLRLRLLIGLAHRRRRPQLALTGSPPRGVVVFHGIRHQLELHHPRAHENKKKITNPTI
ncbi:hypothetical protein [Enterobacter asburiae]